MTEHLRPLCLLGATGSIGTNTLLVAGHLGIPIHTLAAGSKVEELASLAFKYRASRAIIGDSKLLPKLRQLLPSSIHAEAGPEALENAAADPACPVVLTAMVGAAGLLPTIAAVKAGKRVAIANKEPLVMAGHLVMPLAKQSGASILPVDSEHSAIFQCLENHKESEVERLILTASGGPFRTRSDLSGITPAQALKHPNWSMGPKITIDSASMMNKALEVIEARWLFGIEAARLDVIVHPQSIVHSMVHYRDGSMLAQLGRPDMRVPIQYALTWPEHLPGQVSAPDLASLGSLTFESIDTNKFPSISLAKRALSLGSAAPAVLNAANEIAVERFLTGSIAFQDIFAIVAGALDKLGTLSAPDLDSCLSADAQARELAREWR